MNLRAFGPALAGCFLGACERAGEGRNPAPTELVHDLGVAARALVGADELWLVTVDESEQGARDGNGDGDALDELVFVLDLTHGLDLLGGLALGAPAAPLLLACDGTAAAFAVDEAAQGDQDLNGDGDALDSVLFVYDREHGTFVNQALAVSSILVGGPLVACAVDEFGQGERDLDGDGDASDSVLAVCDLRDGSLEVLSLRDSVPLLVSDERVALSLSEREGLDLTGDDDDLDRAVFEVYDGRTRLLHNTTLAMAGPAVAGAGGTFGLSVSEEGFGRGDLSGDGDTDDAVFHVYDPVRGFSVNLRLVVPQHPAPLVDGERYLLHAFERPSGVDANDDGDLDDLVVHVFEAQSGVLFSTGLASQGGAVWIGDWLGVSVSEAMQGDRDLDLDGDAMGDVVHVLELATGTLENLRLDSSDLLGSQTHLFLAPSEASGAADWNADGDRLDQVLFDWSALDGRARSGAAVGAVLAVQGDLALVLARESERGGDGNGDGDADDLLFELDVAGGIRPLGLAAGSVAHVTERRALVLLVDEATQGRDLNDDGDLADEVLHLVETTP